MSRTQAEKRKAIIGALLDRDGAKKSNGTIANLTGTAKGSVQKFRRILEDEGKIDKVDYRVGIDGRTYPCITGEL
jgi:hypothetical protein